MLGSLTITGRRAPARRGAPRGLPAAGGRMTITSGMGLEGATRQVQMFSLAVLGAKLEAGCGFVRGPALAVLP